MAGDASAGWATGLQVGRFQLVRELARGGMAEIWVAQDQTPGGTSQPVVVKRMLGEADDLGPFQMLLDEARILSQLHHPGIVRVFGLEELDGSPAIVMELVGGITLEQLLRRSERLGRMPPPLAVFIASRVAGALGYAHRKASSNGAPLQIIHRDVSPGNIMITEQGGVKLLDFGIARARNRSTKTQTGYIKGKLAYMSPEQASGRELDARSDVFALGLVLAETLTGQSVYTGKTETQIASMLGGEEKYPPVHDRNPVVPRSLEMLLEEALSIDPKSRPADGAGFSERLEGWLSLQPSKPHESDLAEYLSAVLTPARSEKPTTSLPIKVSQRTPSYRPATPPKPINSGWLALAAAVLFAVSLAIGWGASRVIWPSPDKSAQAVGAGADHPR